MMQSIVQPAPMMQSIVQPAPMMMQSNVVSTTVVEGAANLQPVTNSASASLSNPTVAPHYFPASVTGEGTQLPPGLFHDPNVIDTNVPGTEGTRFVCGPASNKAIMSAPTVIAAPTIAAPTMSIAPTMSM